MDEAEGIDSTIESLTTRMLVLNFTAIHVCLYCLLSEFDAYDFADRRLPRYALNIVLGPTQTG